MNFFRVKARDKISLICVSFELEGQKINFLFIGSDFLINEALVGQNLPPKYIKSGFMKQLLKGLTEKIGNY